MFLLMCQVQRRMGQVENTCLIYQDQIPVNCNHWRIRDSTVKRLDILLCPCMGVWIWVWPDINAVLLFVYELEIFCEEAAVSGSFCSNEERTVCGLALAWVKAMTDPNWVSSRHWCIGCSSSGEAGWLWFGTLTTNLHFPSTFLPYISNGQLLSLDDILSSFIAIGWFRTSWYFPPKSHLIVIFFSLIKFLVA